MTHPALPVLLVGMAAIAAQLAYFWLREVREHDTTRTNYEAADQLVQRLFAEVQGAHVLVRAYQLYLDGQDEPVDNDELDGCVLLAQMEVAQRIEDVMNAPE